jgi:hypothetical protein
MPYEELGITHVYNYVIYTYLCRRQAEIIKNHTNSNISAIGQEDKHMKHKGLKYCGGQAYDRSNKLTDVSE